MNAYGEAIEALGEPMRRTILERLRSGPRAVGELAVGLPVSRPAVSQHLRVLEEAGLVQVRPAGTRRIYSLDPDGIAGVRAYFDAFWDDALAAFKAAAEREGTMATMGAALAPIVKTVHVECDVDRAFRLFTDELTSWWPMRTHSVGGEEVERVVWEGTPGGAVYEQQADGSKGADWGRILEWNPPHRLVMSWFPGHSHAEATELEVRFTPDGDGTRLELEHRAWGARGDKAEQMRAAYDTGWDDVLGCMPGASTAA